MQGAGTYLAAAAGLAQKGSPVAALAIALLLSGCGFNVREDLGLKSTGPDEFSVVKKKPLQMPTDSSALPAPRPGAASLVDPTPTEDARAALTGKRVSASTQSAPSKAESALLSAAKADQADPSIRKKLEAENTSGEERLLDSFLGKSERGKDPLDPEKEAERLAEEARKGKNPGLERPAEN